METLRQTLKTLFLLQKSQTVIDRLLNAGENRFLDAKVERDWFVHSYLDDVSPIRTKDQVDSIYALLTTKWMEGDEEIKSLAFSPTPSVFNALLHFSVSVLRELHYEPVCRYDDLLRWHELTTLLGEDLFTTSFFAAKDLKQQMVNHQYSVR